MLIPGKKRYNFRVLTSAALATIPLSSLDAHYTSYYFVFLWIFIESSQAFMTHLFHVVAEVHRGEAVKKRHLVH
jgi:hypothetical protein